MPRSFAPWALLLVLLAAAGFCLVGAQQANRTAALEEALLPFAAAAETADRYGIAWAYGELTVSDLHRAREVLSK